MDYERKYKIRLIIGSVLFGVIVFSDEVIKDGQWNMKGLLWVAYGIVSFGILFNLLFKLLVKEYKKKDKTEK